VALFGRPIFLGWVSFPVAVRSQSESGLGRRCVDVEKTGVRVDFSPARTPSRIERTDD